MDQKKDITKKELLKLIEVKLNKGVSKPGVYKEISDSYSVEKLDADVLPRTIAYFPDADLKLKYKKQNMVLYMSLFVAAVFKVVSSIPSLFNLQAIGILLMVFLPFVNIWLAMEVMKTRAYVYKVIGVLAIAGFLNSLTLIESSGWWIILDVILLGVVSFLGFKLSKVMFPNYNYSGPTKDENGDWKM